jgi:hypothetical protein
MAITHKYTLVCDDVRQEINGKFIVIGLYTPNMAVSQIPFVLPFLTFFMFINADRPGTSQMRMRLERLDTGQRLIEGMGMINVQAAGPGASPIRIGPIQLQAAGTYNFIVEIEGEREPIITPFEVTIGPPQPIRPR